MAWTSWMNPGTMVGTGWANVDYAKTSNNQRASDYVPTGTYSGYLKGTNFGFTLNPLDEILGAQVKIERRADIGGDLRTDLVYIFKDGPVYSDTKGPGSYWTTGDVIEYYGGAAQMWGLDFDANDVNHVNFGCMFRVQNLLGGGTVLAECDHLSIRISYSPLTLIQVACINIPAVINSETVRISYTELAAALNISSVFNQASVSRLDQILLQNPINIITSAQVPTIRELYIDTNAYPLIIKGRRNGRFDAIIRDPIRRKDRRYGWH